MPNFKPQNIIRLLHTSTDSAATHITNIPISKKHHLESDSASLKTLKSKVSSFLGKLIKYCQSNDETVDSSISSSKVHNRKLTHIDSKGNAVMIGVDKKPDSYRTAKARVKVLLGQEAFDLVTKNLIKKGDVLTVAQIAGIMAAKQTSHLIPLCHNIPITKVDINCHLDEAEHGIIIETKAEARWKTGVEMEALVAASVAALTVYDMCKAVTHEIVITDLMLISKTGGTTNYIRKTIKKASQTPEK